MHEIELKAKVPHASVKPEFEVNSIESRGFQHQIDCYFNHPSKDFGDTDEALRLRKVLLNEQSSKSVLTYKGPRLATSTKSRPETEVLVEDYDALVAIFDALEFTPVATVEKERIIYQYQNCLICLDDVVGLGEFVEIEAQDSFSSVTEAEAAVQSVREALGIDESAITQQSYLEMLLHHDA